MTSTMADTMSSTDRIEKRVVLRAPLGRVWQAIADSKQFGEWFRVQIDQPFVAGKTVNAKITKPEYAHIRLEMEIESVEPQRYFSYRWHPYAIDAKADYSKEPTTLVEFKLEQVADGTELTIVESGFDRLPASRRAEAFRMNELGWTGQAKNLAQYVEK